MNLFSIVLSLILAGMLSALVIAVPVAIARNLKQGKEHRKLLGGRVAKLRLGQPKIEKFRATFGQHNIARLEIAMNQPLMMGRVETTGNLDRDLEHLIVGN